MALVFVGRDPGRLSAPFGPSHDGFNAALYMTGGRAILEEGPLESRLGARSHTVSGDPVVYAHHPPLAYLADAAALAATGVPEIAARLPAVVASLVVLVLLVLLLAAVGLPPGSAAVGLLVAFATPMFLMFGTMVEPHALGLAPMVALALLWQRIRLDRAPATWVLVSVAALATLTSWLAALFAGCVGLVLLAARQRRRPGVAVLAGAVAGAVLVGLWIWWAYAGDLGEFVHRAVLRTGVGAVRPVTIAQAARQQMRYLADLFPIGAWLVVPVAALGLLDRRTRPLVAVSLGTVLGYALLFRNGAYDHDYWLYCLLLPLALGAAATADAVTRWASRRVPVRAAPAVLGAGLVVALGITLWRPSNEQRERGYATAIGAEARAVHWPPAQRYAYHAFGDRGPTDLLPWVLFYSRRQPFGVAGPQAVPQGEVVLRMVDGRLLAVPGERGGGR